MGLYSKEEIIRIESIDIVDYCKNNGIPVKDESRRYSRLVEHDSCVINKEKNLFYWNSRGIQGGNIINFVREYEGVGFKEAMEKLQKGDYEKNEQINQPIKQEPFIYDSSTEINDFKKARNYLVKDRKIDSELVDKLHDEGLIKQDKRNNVMFLWKENERIVGCDLQGTYNRDKSQKRTWKGVQPNSTADYGFNIKNGEPKNLKFFESPVDLLSYATLNKNKLKDTQLISMGGLKQETIINYIVNTSKQLKDTPDSIAICVDNDKAGKEFTQKFTHLKVKRKNGTDYNISYEFPSEKYGKDWNDQLKELSNQHDLEEKKYQIDQTKYIKENDKILYVDYAGKKLEVKFDRYKNNNETAIQLYNPRSDPDSEFDYDDLWATATVNTATPFGNPFEEKYNPSLVTIKDYSENAGMYDALVNSGVIEKEPERYVHSGMVKMPVAVLTEKALEEAKRQMPEIGEEIDQTLENKKEYSFENIKEQLNSMMDNNYKNYIKAQISIEKGINDEKILDKVYEKYMTSDRISPIDVEFDEMIDNSTKEVQKDRSKKDHVINRALER